MELHIWLTLRYWPDIDDQLRRMAIDKSIRVRLLVSQWAHTPPAMSHFLKSLTDLSRVYPHVDIQVVRSSFTGDLLFFPTDEVLELTEGVLSSYIHSGPGKDSLC